MPRWRTMIEPAVTSWPSPAFTPSRWPTLSRPVGAAGGGLGGLRRGLGARSGLGLGLRLGRGLGLVLRLGRGLGGLLLGGGCGLGGLRLLRQLRGERLVGGGLPGGLFRGGGLEALALGDRVGGELPGALAVELDVRDAQDGQVGAVALLDAAACLGPVLEDDDLVAAVLAHDVRADAGALHERLAGGRPVLVGHEQDALELDRLAWR